MAELLSGAWRGLPPAPCNSLEELEEIAKLLLVSGAASLAWCKIRHSDLGSSSVADGLHQAYRMDTLHAALHQRTLKQIIPLLRASAVEPLLVKGWAIARHYPEPGMRPYIDLDLCVLPDQYATAGAVLKDAGGRGTNVDLHLGFGKFYDRRTDEIFARSRLVKLDDVDVRVLCAEDNLRYLCLHLLRHGAVRPLWLCDIAVAVESRTPDFDWDRCLSGTRREAEWVGSAIGLAAQLLGADISETPVARQAEKLPAWLVNAVLRDWGRPFRSRGQILALMRDPLRFLRELPKELLSHWPNPIEATMALGGPLNRVPRLPFQVGHVVSRTTVLLSQLIGELGGAIQHRS